ncbi:exostosin family protein [Striga asiatica]|uniref:peroxidase n=1 Tax=Striga asiatica TaxID=4170 RepID=A0A5A7PXV2_STRAF|nr:exostosin family protein [Striga asiatica]
MKTFLFILVAFRICISEAQLKVGFYSQTCPNAEPIVRSVIKNAAIENPRIPPALIRLHFHDCFVEGCDGSILIENGENTADEHQGLIGFEVISEAKEKLEDECPIVVSCADIVAMAARDSLALAGGPTYEVETGRRDGPVSNPLLAKEMPNIDDPIDILNSKFRNKGPSHKELVLLSVELQVQLNSSMAGINSASKSSRFSSSQSPHHSTCTRTHQIAALVLVAVTFFLTRLSDRSLGPCPSSHRDSFSESDRSSHPDDVVRFGLYGIHLNLKIYVYDEDEIEGLKLLMYGREGKISADACVKGQWGTQVTRSPTGIVIDYPLNKEYVSFISLKVKIHRLLLQSTYRTRKKEEADLFFVPSYVKCVRMKGGLNDKEINQTYVKVLSQMPYFRLSGGRNHIFVFPSGAGAHLFKSWSTYINRSIILTPEGDRTDKRDTSAFNTWKDIIIPGNVDDGMTSSHKSRLVDPLPLSRRKYLANYLGRAQGKAGRLKLMDLAKQYPDKLESPELKFSGPDKLGRTEYFQHLRNAKFCLAPRGESSWTLRFYESFFVECVPVILSDQVELPFQNVVDYSQISIKWPSNRIGTELLDYLGSIPDKAIEEMIARGRRVRCLWVYAPESESCSAFEGILWELQKKVRLFHQSAETFWLHNGSIVNRDLVEFGKWKPPMALP